MAGMQIAQWYIQNFSDTDLYFFPVSLQKNGGLSGVEVRVDVTRPRAKPKAIKSSVWASEVRETYLWTAVRDEEVPIKVRAAAADKLGLPSGGK